MCFVGFLRRRVRGQRAAGAGGDLDLRRRGDRSSYKAGLMFTHEMQQAERQRALHWQVDGKLSRNAAGDAVLDIHRARRAVARRSPA